MRYNAGRILFRLDKILGHVGALNEIEKITNRHVV